MTTMAMATRMSGLCSGRAAPAARPLSAAPLGLRALGQRRTFGLTVTNVAAPLSPETFTESAPQFEVRPGRSSTGALRPAACLARSTASIAPGRAARDGLDW